MNKKNENKKSEVVVITGSSAGVGRATAHRFAREGAKVALLARGSKSLEGAADEIRAMGCQVLAIPTDVSDAAQVEAAAERVAQELGPIDIWINAAMATIFAPVNEITSEEFQRVTKLTYMGAVHGTLSALKRMRPRNRGKIVQVGSALAYRSVPLQSPYCGAKLAIRGFTDALRVELMHDKSKVPVTMVLLSAFDTPRFQWGRTRLPRRPQPVPPIYQPEVAVDGIHYAVHHYRRELWVGYPVVKTITATDWCRRSPIGSWRKRATPVRWTRSRYPRIGRTICLSRSTTTSVHTVVSTRGRAVSVYSFGPPLIVAASQPVCLGDADCHAGDPGPTQAALRSR